MADDAHSQVNGLSCQLRECSSEDVGGLLDDLCTALFGPQLPNGTLSEAESTRLVSMVSRITLKGRPRPTDDVVLDAVVLLKSLLTGVFIGEHSLLKKLVRRLDDTLLPTLFLKTSIRPSHLRAALCISPEFVTAVAHASTLETLRDWKVANQWDFLPPSRTTASPSRHVLTNSSDKENVSNSPCAAAVCQEQKSSLAACGKPTGARAVSGPHVNRPRSTPATSILPTRGIPSYLITKRGARASTPPPTDNVAIGAQIDLPSHVAPPPLLNEDSNSTLVLESPVKRRRLDCHVIPPSPKRE